MALIYLIVTKFTFDCIETAVTYWAFFQILKTGIILLLTLKIEKIGNILYFNDICMAFLKGRKKKEIQLLEKGLWMIKHAK